MILPPKRFEPIDDPIYDPIRFRPWFKQLEVRRAQLEVIKAAAKYMHERGTPLGETATNWGIERHDLGCYISFINGRSITEEMPEHTRRAYQYVLDRAYKEYCAQNAENSFSSLIIKNSQRLVSPDRATEYWDVDPHFYPRKYKYV